MPFRSAGVALVGSISSTTGALIGGLGAGGPVLAAIAAEMVFGRPSSTAVVAVATGFLVGESA